MRALLFFPCFLVLAGCLSGPAMVPASGEGPPAVAADRARVVFFMAAWQSDPSPFERHPHGDTSMAVVVVDEAGQVVGTLRPGAYVVADVAPGAHEFFAEDARFDTGCVTTCAEVGALRATLAAGRTYGVMAEFPNRFSIGVGQSERSRLDLVRAGGAPLGRPGWTWLRPEDAAAWAREHAARVANLIRAGRERMARDTEWDARASSIEP